MDDSKAVAVEEFITTEVAPDLRRGSLPRDEDMLATELIDSVGIVALVGFLESRFGIEIGDEDLTPENFRTIDSIVAFVASKGG